MIQVDLYDENAMNQWDEYVSNDPNGSVFHCSRWLKVIFETYQFKPMLYMSKNLEGSVSGVFPSFIINKFFLTRKYVSLPFSDYGGPLFLDEDGERQFLFHMNKELNDGRKHYEVRSLYPGDNNFEADHKYVKHIIKLEEDPDKIWKNVNKKTIKYSIKKSLKCGVTIHQDNSEYGVNEFFRLNKLTRKKHGVPSQPLLLFEKIYEHFIASDEGSISLAKSGSKIIAAGLFLKLNNTVYYKYSAADPVYLLQKKPNHLMTWEAIKRACLDGYSDFDFGRTIISNEGLCRYKEMWGAEKIKLPYCYYPKALGVGTLEGSGRLYRLMTSIWKNTPEFVSGPIGSRIYKYMA